MSQRIKVTSSVLGSIQKANPKDEDNQRRNSEATVNKAKQVKFQTCAFIKSSLLSAKKCRAIMLLRSRMHCLSPSDKPNIGSGVGRNGTPPRLLSTKECKKLDSTLCGGPAIQLGGNKLATIRTRKQIISSVFMLEINTTRDVLVKDRP